MKSNYNRFITKVILLIATTFLSACHNEIDGINYFEKTEQDFWANLKQSFTFPDHLSNHPKVKSEIKKISQHKNEVNKSLEKAAIYMPFIMKEIQSNNLPAELILLPLVESNYNPFAYSSVGATGIWQMVPSTASGFGLDINWKYDSRRDIILSTKAALNYLKHLNHRFDDNWLLTIAAYDCGEGTILKSIKKSKLKKPVFWRLKLPKETTDYIPKLLALREIIKNSEQFGIKLPQVKSTKDYKTFKINKTSSIQTITKATLLSESEFRKYNPLALEETA